MRLSVDNTGFRELNSPIEIEKGNQNGQHFNENLSVVFRSRDHHLSSGLHVDGKKSWACHSARSNEFERSQSPTQIQKNYSRRSAQGLLEKRTINKPKSLTIRQSMLWSCRWVARASTFFMPNFNKEAFYKGNKKYERKYKSSPRTA